MYVAITAALIAAGLFGVVVVLGLHLAEEPEEETVVRPSSAGASVPPLSSTAPTSEAVPAAPERDAAVDADAASAQAEEPVSEPPDPPSERRRRRRERDGARRPRMPRAEESDDGPDGTSMSMRRPLITDSF